MAIRAVVFDLFDTLVDLSMHDLPRVEIRGESIPSTAGVLHEAVVARSDVEFQRFIDTLAEMDQELRVARHERGLELPTLERFEALMDRLSLDAPELPGVLTHIHMGLIRQQVTVPEHHEELLSSLGRRVLLGLCSNFSHSETALGVLDEFGLLAHLDTTAISDTVGFRKPRSEIFEAVLGELGVEPAETLHVGDNLHDDIGGASRLGIGTVWITRRVLNAPCALREHPGPPPDHVIRDLAEVEALLDFSATKRGSSTSSRNSGGPY